MGGLFETHVYPTGPRRTFLRRGFAFVPTLTESDSDLYAVAGASTRRVCAVVPRQGNRVGKNANTPFAWWRTGCCVKGAGDDLLSHKASLAVPSAQEGLTTEFGMGSGGAPPVK